MNLRSYFKETQNIPLSSPQTVIGGGEFRKKGARVKNWKIRSYYIKADGMLLYFDPITKEPKGILDINEVEISIGPLDNLNKSGCSNFSTEKGHSIYISTPKKNMEIVFDTTKSARNFVSQLLQASPKNRNNIRRYLKAMKWEDLDVGPVRESQRDNQSISSQSISTIQSNVLNEDDDEYDDEYDITTSTEGEVDGFIKFRPTIDELLHGEYTARARSKSLPSSPEDEEFSGGRVYAHSVTTNSSHEILLSGRFYKQGAIRKQWKLRYFEIWAEGILAYKEYPDSMFFRGKLNIRSCIANQVDVYVPYSAAATATSTSSSLNREGVVMVRVSALEIRSIQDKKVYMIAFDIASPDRNRALQVDFEKVLKIFSNTVHSPPSSIPSPAATSTVPPVLAQTPIPVVPNPPLGQEKSSTSSPSSSVSVRLIPYLWSLIPSAILNPIELHFAITSDQEKGLLLFLMSLLVLLIITLIFTFFSFTFLFTILLLILGIIYSLQFAPELLEPIIGKSIIH